MQDKSYEVLAFLSGVSVGLLIGVGGSFIVATLITAP